MASIVSVSERRGFAVGTAGGVLHELYQKAIGLRFSGLDVAATALGAGAGAIVTDLFNLMPVVTKSEQGTRYYGFVSQYRF